MRRGNMPPFVLGDGKLQHKTILSTNGFEILVSDIDYSLIVAMGNWYARKIGNTRYAVRQTKVCGKQKTIYLHRLLIPKSTVVDHINGNGLDCRRENIRSASHAENLRNRGKQANNKSGFKGVYFHKASNKWHASIKSDGKRYYLGLFLTASEASDAYKKKAFELWPITDCSRI